MNLSNEIFEIGDVDKLKIVFNSQSVTFINSLDSSKKSNYNYSQIKEVILNNGKTNWLLSMATLILDIFSDLSVGGKYRRERTIEIATDKERLTLHFCKLELNEAEKIAHLLRQKANL